MLLPLSEAGFQVQVMELAKIRKWRVAHFRVARTKKGWRTPVAADGKGWPDLALVRDRILYRELKSQEGILSPDQLDWLKALIFGGGDAKVWRPSDWPEIEETLA